MKTYGLIGKSLGHSFSKSYFEKKFKALSIENCIYQNFELPNIECLNDLIESTPSLLGFNVTIPFKTSIIPLLDNLSNAAKQIGAVNCVRITRNGSAYSLSGHNTDYLGFINSLKPLLNNELHTKALVLGTGGAAKAIHYGLSELNIKPISVGRSNGELLFSDLTSEIILHHKLIVNCTPVGTFPNIDDLPSIPLNGIGNTHLVYDLIYNPETTRLLSESAARGAEIKNGLEMLQIQAEKSWEIWNHD